MERALETDTAVFNGTDAEVIGLLQLRQVVFSNAKDDNPHKFAYEAARDSAVRELIYRLSKRREAICLLNSMVKCGEDHSDISRQVVADALT
jgi:hypothetical protein